MTHEASDMAAGLLLVVLVATVTAAIAGAAAAARRAGTKGMPTLGAVIVVVGWVAIAMLVARSGVLRTFDALPPRLPLLPLVAIVGGVAAGRTKRARELLAVTPLAWPIALQAFRIGIELVLYLLYRDGQLPIAATFEGRNPEILVGLTAPLVALAVQKGWAGRRTIILWNVLGLASLVVIVSTVIRALPGPLHVDLGVAPIVMTTVPFFLVPALAVPIAVQLHVLSLRQAWGSAPARL